MAFSIDRVTSGNWALDSNSARTPAQLAEELTFKNALAALQMEDSNTELSTEGGSSNFLDPYASLIQFLAQRKNVPETPKVPQTMDVPSAATPTAPAALPVESSGGMARLASLNNNPGNLRFAHQTGAMPGVGGFARFESPEAGYQALMNQIRLDASRGYTLAQYITKYAPPSENDTALYIEQASQSLGIDANTPLGKVDFHRLAAFQARKESGTIVG
jgi:hypothetical protein